MRRALRSLITFPISVLLFGCTVTATRPLQEMSNADAALRAAKSLHADVLSSDLYRTASENYFKAKREYRLKNFNAAKSYAIRAMKYAEKAEFAAYKKGGATPETATDLVPPEGALPDPESAVEHSSSSHKQHQSPAPATKKTPPGGQSGPQNPNYRQEEDKTEDLEFRNDVGGAFPVPQTGAMPGSVPSEYTTRGEVSAPSKVRRINEREQRIRDEDLPQRDSAEVPTYSPSEMRPFVAKPIQNLGDDAAKTSDGAPTLQGKEISDLSKSKEIPHVFETKGDKE